MEDSRLNTLTLFLLLLLPAAASPQDYSIRRDSLVVAWGEKNYSGSADCSANASIASTDSTLVIEIDVVDDKLVLGNDPLRSDHVELWFAISQLYDFDPNSDDSYFDTPYRTSYLWDGNKQLYLFKGKADLKGFEREIRSPSISASNYGEKRLLYEDLDCRDESWLKREIDQYLGEARRSKLTEARMFYCITHLGILPENGEVVLYDRENYSVLERMIEAGIPDLSRFATCRSVTKPNGYSVTITLRPEAIGFSFNEGITQLRYMIDVVDVDERGRQETILSSSPKRRWGDPSTFKQLDLYPPIRVPLDAGFPEAGDPKARHYSEYDFLPMNYLSHYFLYTTVGWIPVERTTDPFNVYNRPFGFALDNINKISFKRGPLSFRMVTKGKDTLRYLSVSRGEFLFVGRRFVFPTRDTLATFFLSDSSTALLVTKFESSGYSPLILAAGSSKTMLTEFWGETEMRFTDSLRFQEKEWDRNRVNWDDMYSDRNFDWSTIFHWERPGRSIVIDLGNGIRIRISWNDRGGNVTYVKF
jgi:hypothetical protein